MNADSILKSSSFFSSVVFPTNDRVATPTGLVSCQRRVSHFGSYEQLREIASKKLFRYDWLNSAHKDGDVNVDVVVNIL